MQSEFRRDTRNQYLVINSLHGEEEKDYRLKMLTGNKIEMFASCSGELVNGKELLYYDVTGKIQLSAYLNTYQADESFFVALFISMAEALERLQEFLLDPDGVLLDPEYMFINADSRKVSFVYYPYSEKKFAENCKLLSEKLLGSIKQDDIKAVKLGYGFYKNCVLGKITPVSLRDMARENDLRSSPTANVGNTDVNAFGGKMADNGGRGLNQSNAGRIGNYDFLFSAEERENEKKKSRGFLDKIFKVKEKEGKYEAAANSAVIRDRHEPFFANSGQGEPVKAWLMPDKGFAQDGIMLVKENYLVGKKAAGADIAFESKTVSRAHAKLIWQRSFYCIVDLSSRNGTRVNGVKLESGEKISLKDGDKIVFADTSCVYRQFNR